MSFRKNSPIYLKISSVKHPSVRATLYEIIKDMWDEYYDKPIVGLSGVINGWKGSKITETLLYGIERLPWKPYSWKLDWDALYFACYVYPAWIGPCLSEDEREGWVYLKKSGLYRQPDFKYTRQDYYQKVYDRLDFYYVPKDKRRVIKKIFEGDEEQIESIIFQIVYNYAVKVY